MRLDDFFCSNTGTWIQPRKLQSVSVHLFQTLFIVSPEGLPLEIQ